MTVSLLRSRRVLFSAWLILGLPCTVYAVCSPNGVPLPADVQFQDTSAMECPNPPCSTTAEGPLTLCVEAGEDPPVTLRPDLGKGISFTGLGSTTQGGKCPPSPDGSDVCTGFPVSGIGAIPAFGMGHGGPGINLASLLINAALSAIPPAACGASAPLNVGAGISCSGVTVHAPPVSAVVGSLANSFGGSCSGSSFGGLSANSINMIMPPTSGSTSISGGTLNPPSGSFLSIPPSTPVSFNLGAAGSMTMPQGGTLLSPAGVPIVIPSGTTITSLGGNQLRIGGTVYSYGAATLPVTTSAVSIASTCPVGLQAGGNVSFPTSR